MKIQKHEGLQIDIQRLWNVKTEVMLRGATGTISKSLKKYLGNIQESTKSRSYRKHPYWALHTYFRIVLMQKYRTCEITLLKKN